MNYCSNCGAPQTTVQGTEPQSTTRDTSAIEPESGVEFYEQLKKEADSDLFYFRHITANLSQDAIEDLFHDPDEEDLA